MATVFRPPLVTRVAGKQTVRVDPVPNLLATTLGSQDTFFGAAGDGPRYDWPNPVLRVRAVVVDPIPNLLATTLAVPLGQMRDWPNPRIAKQPLENLSFTGKVSLLLAGQDQFFGDPGQPPVHDWPNPSRIVQPQTTGPFPSSLANLLGEPPASPFVPGDWPNPSIAKQPLENLSFVGQVFLLLVGQDQFFGDPGQPPSHEWPNPSRSVRPHVVEPFTNPLANLLGELPATPFVPGDWPNPRAVARPENLGFASGTDINLFGQDQFFGAPGEPPGHDWPNPLASRKASAALPVPNLLTGTLGVPLPQPFAQSAWPNPPLAVPPREGRGFVGGVALLLVGQDQFFFEAGRGPRYDWPNPKTRPWPPHDPGPGMFRGIASSVPTDILAGITFTERARPLVFTERSRPLVFNQPER